MDERDAGAGSASLGKSNPVSWADRTEADGEMASSRDCVKPG